ncbi:MAG TPA: bifunctional acetate--CoA ligase family protein/GNAT family N-acetyltransferase [Candidatus Competibacteraceae bacterium]|nr:bifunctional acetate--CoA ligase family protein/GNAT family N-acetyltransferase [Candidatus Competibacteraceae bacterium]
MSTRNLAHLFNPSSVAVIGQGGERDARLMRNLLSAAPRGPVLPVNANQAALEGVLTYPSVASLPLTPMLAILSGPLAGAPALIRELGERGTRAVLLLSEELLDPAREADRALAQAMLDAAKPYTLRILGPDSLGLASPGNGLNATLSHTPVKSGHIAMVSQSSAVLRGVVDWAASRDIGFIHLLSVGARIDVDFSDLLDYLAQDTHTRAILLYLEQIRKPRKFLSAARIAARIKPVVVLKPRDHSHDPQEDAIYDSAFRRAGILRVSSIEQLFAAVETLATIRPVYNNRLAIMGNSRSLSLLASESLLYHGGRLARFGETVQAELGHLLPSGLQVQNPLDLGDSAGAELYGQVLDKLLQDADTDAVLVLHAPTAPETDLEIARRVIRESERSQRLVLTSWIGGRTAEQARQLFQEHRMACYANPSDAARVFTRVAEYARNQELLMATPPSLPEAFSVDAEAARAVLRRALAEGRSLLDAAEASTVLAAYGIPVAPTRIARSPQEAAAIAAEMRGPLALKIASPDIRQRLEVGGVRLGLDRPEQVAEAAEMMLQRVASLAPQARVVGFVLQPLLPRHGGYELTVGVRASRGFGPVIRFGHGGSETEVIDDLAYALPPLNMKLALELISRTRIYRLLSQSPERSVDQDELCLTLLKVSQMVVDLAELAELEINPLRAGRNGVIALDAWISVQPAIGPASERLAIRPYPKELEQEIVLPDGRRFLLRPIVPEDEPALQEMVRRTPAEDLRLRFFQPIRELSHAMAARLTQLDYDREMALAVCEPGIPGKAAIWAVVRMTTDSSLDRAEYAILVNRAMAGLGLGSMLMRCIIDYARSRGIRELYGEVLRENKAMLRLNRALGFRIEADPDDPAVMQVTLEL